MMMGQIPNIAIVFAVQTCRSSRKHAPEAHHLDSTIRQNLEVIGYGE